MSQAEECAGGLLQAHRARRAGDEHGVRGVHVLHEGKGEGLRTPVGQFGKREHERPG